VIGAVPPICSDIGNMNLHHSADIKFLPVPFIDREIELDHRPDGSIIVRNKTILKPYEVHLPALLRRAAAANPDRSWLAQRRGANRDWVRLSYSDAQRQVDALTQYLLDLDAASRTVMILSGNSIEHGVMALAAMQAHMPVSPISTAYSLRSKDFGKLKDMARLLKPKVIFVQSAKEYQHALSALASPDIKVIYVEEPIGNVDGVAFSDAVSTPVTAAVADAVGRLTGDTVAKYMFTSGSTSTPKAVITTHKMLCSNVVLSDMAIKTEPESPPHVTIDWLPWSHVMGGNSIFGMTLHKGGTLYIDDGKPLLEAFSETINNLREVSPTRFANVPIGYAMLADAMERDDELAKKFFKHLRFLGYAGARLADDTYYRIQTLAIKHTGHRISFLSGFGATETGPFAMYVYWQTGQTGLIGLPLPGVDVKLVPIDAQRYEIRARSPSITPGYLENEEQTKSAFDDEGFYKLGDAASFVDKDNPDEGFIFAGRVAEEFKLQSGTFVKVGALRVKVVDALAPLASDVVIAGADQDFVAALVWPNLQGCRQFLKRPDATLADVVADPAVRDEIKKKLAAHNLANPGNSNQVRRAILMAVPLSIDTGESTDKGYTNQRRTLETRKDSVDRLFQQSAGVDVIEA